VQYKRKIQNRKIQSKRVLGLTKYTHRLLDHNKVTQKDFFVEAAHRKSKGVLILRTISCHNTISAVGLLALSQRYITIEGEEVC
jgi:hypothetical protein